MITLLRYDVGATTEIFSALPMQEQTSISIWMDRLNWLSLFQRSVPLYLLLGMSFVLCACICYPVGQLCGKLLGATDALKAYGLNLVGSILGVLVLFVMSLFWLPPVIWFAAIGGVLLLFRAGARRETLPLGVASFSLLLAVLAWPVQTDIQRIYSPYQLLEKMAKSDGLMNILSGGSYYQKVFNLSEANRGHEPARGPVSSAPITSFRSTSRSVPSVSRSSAPAAATTWRRRCAWARPMSTPSRSIRRSSSSAGTIIPSIPMTIRASTSSSTMPAISSAPRISSTI